MTKKQEAKIWALLKVLDIPKIIEARRLATQLKQFDRFYHIMLSGLKINEARQDKAGKLGLRAAAWSLSQRWYNLWCIVSCYANY